MIGDRRPFEPEELRDAVRRLDALEVAPAFSMGRALERALGVSAHVRPSDGFADRVMATVAAEPPPTRAIFLAPLRDGFGLAALLASVRSAFDVAASPSLAWRPRATALAYVLTIVLFASSVAGVAGYGAAGALGLLSAPAPTPAPTVPVVTSPSAVVAPSPSETDGPGETIGPGDGSSAEPGDGSSSEPGDGSSSGPGVTAEPEDGVGSAGHREG